MSNSLEPLLRRFTIREGTAPAFFARVLDYLGDAPLRADLDDITVKIWNITDGVVSAADPDYEDSLVINSVWFDTMQTAGWEVDSTGYNFLVQLPAAEFTCSGTTTAVYRVEIYATPGSGEGFWVLFADVTVKPANSV